MLACALGALSSSSTQSTVDGILLYGEARARYLYVSLTHFMLAQWSEVVVLLG